MLADVIILRTGPGQEATCCVGALMPPGADGGARLRAEAHVHLTKLNGDEQKNTSFVRSVAVRQLDSHGVDAMGSDGFFCGHCGCDVDAATARPLFAALHVNVPLASVPRRAATALAACACAQDTSLDRLRSAAAHLARVIEFMSTQGTQSDEEGTRLALERLPMHVAGPDALTDLCAAFAPELATLADDFERLALSHGALAEVTIHCASPLTKPGELDSGLDPELELRDVGAEAYDEGGLMAVRGVLVARGSSAAKCDVHVDWHHEGFMEVDVSLPELPPGSGAGADVITTFLQGARACAWQLPGARGEHISQLVMRISAPVACM